MSVGSIAGGYIRDFDEPLPRSDKPPPVAEPIEEEKLAHKEAPKQAKPEPKAHAQVEEIEKNPKKTVKSTDLISDALDANVDIGGYLE